MLGSSQYSSRRQEQKDKMNDVKLAVLGGEGTGKSGELCCFLWHGSECKKSEKYIDLIDIGI